MNWNSRKIIEILLILFGIVSFIFMVARGFIDINGIISILLFLIFVVLPIFLALKFRNKRITDPDYIEYEKNRNKSSTSNNVRKEAVDEILDKENNKARNKTYQIPRRSHPNKIYKNFGNQYDKAININNHTLLANDDNKEFILVKDHLLYRYDYENLKDFKYYEDGGETIELSYGNGQIRPGIVQEESSKQIQDDIVGNIGILINIDNEKDENVDFKLSIARNNRKGNFFSLIMDQADEILQALSHIKENV